MYSLEYKGSVGFLLRFQIVLMTESQMVHWYHTTHQEKVIHVYDEGIGYFQDLVAYNSNDFVMELMSAILVPSLAFDE